MREGLLAIRGDVRIVRTDADRDDWVRMAHGEYLHRTMPSLRPVTYGCAPHGMPGRIALRRHLHRWRSPVIIPLANRVLIKPDPPPEQTASGLHIPDNATREKDFEMSGIVVRTGTGPASAQRVRDAMITQFHKLIDTVADSTPSTGVCAVLKRELARMRLEAVNLSEIHPGDHVAFPYTAGTVLEADGVRHLLMNEDQVVAILERAQ